MKKLLIFLLCVLSACIVRAPSSTDQPTTQSSQTKIAEVVRIWETKHINVTDGFVYKYTIHDKSDTAIYYQTGIDTFEVTSTFKQLNKPYVPPKPDLVTNMDDNTISTAQRYEPPTNPGDNIQVQGLWTHFKGQTWNANHYANTASVLRTAGYVELTCTCYKVEWYSEVRLNHGIVGISIDSGVPVDLDLYKATDTNNSTLVWTAMNMTNATHKIRIAFTGRKNPSATETNFIHDRFVIYTRQQ